MFGTEPIAVCAIRSPWTNVVQRPRGGFFLFPVAENFDAMNNDSPSASATLSATGAASSSVTFSNANPYRPRVLTRIRESANSNAEVVARAQSTLEREFTQHCPRSAQLYARALQVFPGGVTHDNRRVIGNSLYVSKARGARKTDVDGNEYIDYWVGHGALIQGHSYPDVVEAVHLASMEMMHPGACHEREILWGELVKETIPSAERVRFTASGSESTALAFRLARAAHNKPVIIKFEGHFHGWLDHAVNGVDLPFETPFSAGVPQAVRDLTLVLPSRDLNLVEDVLKNRKDIAGIVIEPTGASGGSVPVKPEFLRGLRALADRYDIALIFDEVITGFRLAPGGAQARFGVMPDLTCLAKILAGGMAGGAVCGSKMYFSKMDFSTDSKHDRTHRVTHYGTFNGNPLSSAAGIATINAVKEADGASCKRAEAFTEALRNGLNSLFRVQNAPWGVYNNGSVFHILTSDAEMGTAIRDRKIDAADVEPRILKQKGALDGVLRRALQLHGVDLPPGRQAWSSAVHSPLEMRETMEAFGLSIERMRSMKCL